MSDKDISSMASDLHAIASEIVVTRVPGTSRAARAEVLAKCFPTSSPHARIEENVDSAMRFALQLAGPDDVVLVTGSMYLVGYVRQDFVPCAVPSSAV
jgi:dihydrofolate synthase/folylpolyglutamate synthase